MLTIEPAPLLADADGVWNHGEGFGAGSAADSGGWFGFDDGTGLQAADVHEWPPGSGWANFGWVDNAPPYGTVNMLRFGGYLRPSTFPLLPNPDHPIYGAVGQPYVDQGAFEAFTPIHSNTYSGQTVLIVIRTRATALFPRDHLDRRLEWRQIYRGVFSPDGLVRNELPQPRGVGSFLSNTDLQDVDRPTLGYLADWSNNQAFFPIVAYPVLSVMHRSTTLNEQRHLQVAQAIKFLLTENSNRNPLGAEHRIPAADIEARVVVCFAGGSNGGHQAHWAALRHPRLVHGCYAEVINPSIQRLYNQHDQFNAVERLSGSGFFGAVVNQSDFLWWNQYVWSQGIETHDISWPRLFCMGQTYRPACFVVGDEDTTSNGTDWASLAAGSVWADHGLVGSSSTFGDPANNTFGWMVADSACHQDLVVPTVDPYVGGGLQFGGTKTAQSLFEQAVDQRAAELAAGQQAPAQPLVHQARNAGQQLRGLDDPHEWWLGRPLGGLDPVNVNGLLKRDDAFFANSQPGACGTMPGAFESMVIQGGKLYAGCAEGVVTAFEVDDTHPTGRKPLVAVARSVKLGNDAFAMAWHAADSVLCVGTRRHLYKLDPTTLAIIAGPVELPWEVAQPRHMKVAEVLGGSPGEELVFHSIHGGLVFYRADNLTPIYEWPEPGIIDFELGGGAPGDSVTILSSRGVVASVSFSASGGSYTAALHGVSRAIPANLATTTLPSQGVPADLELMDVDWGAASNYAAAISSWSGDVDGNSVRGHWFQPPGWAVSYQMQPFLPNTLAMVDIATCNQNQVAVNGPGDHALVLGQDSILLADQSGASVGLLKLCFESTSDHNTFGTQSHCMVVGELVGNAGSNYEDEVVIATNTGLFWVHVQEIADAGGFAPMPSDYDIQRAIAGATQTNVQPHTNMSLGASYAISTDPQDGFLHVLDGRGNYWRVDSAGSVSLHDRENIEGVRAWNQVGMPTGTGAILPPDVDLEGPAAFPNAIRYGVDVVTNPWCPIDTSVVVFEKSGGAYKPANWRQRKTRGRFFAGFALFDQSGCAVPRGAGHEVWRWSGDDAAGQPWWNMVEGLRLDAAASIAGIWASTAAQPASVNNGIGDFCDYHVLRTQVGASEAFDVQSMQAVAFETGAFAGATAVVLGCPGGRVRVLMPGAMRTSAANGHVLGSIDATEDLGYGGAALAIRHDVDAAGDVIRIWFGTVGDNLTKPSVYANAGASLQDFEVSTGKIHAMEWRPGAVGSTGFSNLTTTTIYPNPSAPRGAYGVVGMEVADVVPSTAGDELIVTTLSGDIIVYAADTMTELWRDHVIGAAGMYNSIVVEDVDGDGLNEIYIAGSFGIWRFFQ